jgi:hypothetical protein
MSYIKIIIKSLLLSSIWVVVFQRKDSVHQTAVCLAHFINTYASCKPDTPLSGYQYWLSPVAHNACMSASLIKTCLHCIHLWSTESSGMYCRVLNWMSTDVSEVRAASIIRVARISKTSVDIQLTRQYIPEGFELHTHRRNNLKFHVYTPRSFTGFLIHHHCDV